MLVYLHLQGVPQHVCVPRCPALLDWSALAGGRVGRCSLVQALEGFRSLSPYQQQRFGGQLHDSFLKHQACKSDKGSGKRFYLQKNEFFERPDLVI